MNEQIKNRLVGAGVTLAAVALITPIYLSIANKERQANVTYQIPMNPAKSLTDDESANQEHSTTVSITESTRSAPRDARGGDMAIVEGDPTDEAPEVEREIHEGSATYNENQGESVNVPLAKSHYYKTASAIPAAGSPITTVSNNSATTNAVPAPLPTVSPTSHASSVQAATPVKLPQAGINQQQQAATYFKSNATSSPVTSPALTAPAKASTVSSVQPATQVAHIRSKHPAVFTEDQIVPATSRGQSPHVALHSTTPSHTPAQAQQPSAQLQAKIQLQQRPGLNPAQGRVDVPRVVTFNTKPTAFSAAPNPGTAHPAPVAHTPAPVANVATATPASAPQPATQTVPTVTPVNRPVFAEHHTGSDHVPEHKLSADDLFMNNSSASSSAAANSDDTHSKHTASSAAATVTPAAKVVKSEPPTAAFVSFAGPLPRPRTPSKLTNEPIEVNQAQIAGWFVQVGVFSDPTRAQDVARTLKQQGYSAYAQPTTSAQGTALTRVTVGPMGTRDEAAVMSSRLASTLQIQTFVKYIG